MSKRIALYLAHVSPRGHPTIDLLVAEIAREVGFSGRRGNEGWSGRGEKGRGGGWVE